MKVKIHSTSCLVLLPLFTSFVCFVSLINVGIKFRTGLFSVHIKFRIGRERGPMVKHLLYNQRVLGSNPALGTLGIVSENLFLGSTQAL